MKETPDLVEEIAEIGQSPEGRNAIALTETEDRTIELVNQMAVELFGRYQVDSSQYEIRTDAFGNMFITFFGEDKEKVIMSGSHVDSVKNGGKYDGVAGVASALRFLERLLHSSNLAPSYLLQPV